MVEVLEVKKINIGTVNLACKADIWWNTMKDKLQRLELTWAKFPQELRAKFCPITI